MAATIDTTALLDALKAKIERESDLSYGRGRDEYLTHYSIMCALSHLVDDIKAGKFDAVAAHVAA